MDETAWINVTSFNSVTFYPVLIWQFCFIFSCEILQDLGKEVQVLFVDYGNTREVKKSDLVEILSDYEELQFIPFQSCNLQLMESELPVIGLAETTKNTDYVWKQIEDLTEQNFIFEVLVFSVTDGSTIHGNLYAYPRSLEEKRKSSAFRDNPTLFFNKFSRNGVFDFRDHLLEMRIIERSEETPVSIRNNAERLCFMRKAIKGLSEDFVKQTKRHFCLRKAHSSN